MNANDVMTKQFHTLKPDDTIVDAVNAFKAASEATGKKVFGMMVIDEEDHLVGMLSMYDILLYIQPRHAYIWSEMEEDIDPDLFSGILSKVRSIFVADLMSTDVVTIAPDTHVMVVVDIMIKQHIRRLPVISDSNVVGIVYLSELFYHLLHEIIE